MEPDFNNLISLSYDVHPTKHKFGATASWSECTDTCNTNFYKVEALAFKHNLELTVFANPDYNAPVPEGMKQGAFATGRLIPQVYYYGSKTPQQQRDYIYDSFGTYATHASYSMGDESDHKYMHPFAGCRNSALEEYKLIYDRFTTLSLPTTVRQNDMGKNIYTDLTRQEVVEECQDRANQCLEIQGWFRDFSHWHNSSASEMDEFFTTQKSNLAGRDIAYVDFGKVMEQRWLASMCYLRSNDDGTQIEINVKWNKNQSNDRLKLRETNTPMSLYLSTKGSSLEGKDIETSVDIIKKDTDEYVLEVPHSEDGVDLIITETVSPVYVNFDNPQISSVSYLSGVLTIETDIPTKSAVYLDTSNTNLYGVDLLTRDNNFTNTHTFDFNTAEDRDYKQSRTLSEIESSDIYVGVIDENNQSIISDKINLI